MTKLNKLDIFKKKNVKRFSIFFSIAFLFLIISKLSNDYKQTIRLKIVLNNLDDEIVLQKDSLNTINAYVKAKGFSLSPFLFKDQKEVIVNAKTDVQMRSDNFLFDVQKHQFLIENQLGDAFEVLSLKPDTLEIAYSKLASKFVPIVLNTEIEYAPGFDIYDEFQLNIDSVKVVGPQSVLDTISSFSTESLLLNGVNSDISTKVKINKLDYTDVNIFPTSIDVSAKIKRFTEGTVQVPITIVNKPEEVVINYFPKEVTVSFYIDLDNFKTIKPDDFIVECDYLLTAENQSYLIPAVVDKPDQIKRVSIKQKRIDFIKL